MAISVAVITAQLLYFPSVVVGFASAGLAKHADTVG